MSEDDRLDRLIRHAMATAAPPALSPDFDERLSARLPTTRLNQTGRMTLTLYSIAAVMFSVWVMRHAAIDWTLVAVAIGAPVAVAAVACRRCLTLMFARP